MTDIEMPDFDNMTPEEITRWMESLAKRQGATEGLTTDADMEIAEIDPNSVVIDEPGYVPSEKFKSSSSKTAEAAKAQPAKETPAAPPPKPAPAPEPVRPPVSVAPPPPAAPAPPPVTSGTPPRGTGERVNLPTERPDSRAGVQRPAASKPEPKPAASDPPPWDTDRPAKQPPPAPPRTAASAPPPAAVPPPAPVQPVAAKQPPAAAVPPPPVPTPAPAAGGDLAWLESLAAGLGGDGLDLSSFGDSPAPAAADTSGADAWLANLVNSGGDIIDTPAPVVPPAPTPARSAAYEEPTSWLDALASGEDSEPVTFEALDDSALPPVPASEGVDAVDWLDALSSSGELGAPASTSGSDDDIEQAIREGRVSPDQMQRWLNQQSEMLSQQPEISLDDFIDPDAPPVPAEMPNWLLEAVQPPEESDVQATGTPALLDDLFEPPASLSPSATSEMPDWLKAPITQEQPAVNFDDIFAADGETESGEDLSDVEPAFQLENDPSDSWAEAFDMEQDQGLGSPQDEPEWYTRNLTDPARIAAVDALASASLKESALPGEEDLQSGQTSDVPNWMVAEVAPPEAAAAEDVPLIMGDVPEWLRETIDTPTDSDMPAWLVETGQYEETILDDLLEPDTMPAPEPIAETFVQPTQPPPRIDPKVTQSAPQFILSADIATSLAQARELSRANNLEEGLRIYEALIRKNAALDDVVGDLEGLKRIHRSDPAVYRVLGDGLMRQGKLQQALDTYRDALSQL